MTRVMLTVSVNRGGPSKDAWTSRTLTLGGRTDDDARAMAIAALPDLLARLLRNAPEPVIEDEDGEP